MKIDRKTDVLILVDFQNDFVTGSLAVDGAEELILIINKYLERFRKAIVSRDRHKKDHPSFTKYGGPWPDHCVDNTYGVETHSGIIFPDNLSIASVDKGWHEEVYSAFGGTSLDTMLKTMKAKRLFICGLAADYCVKATVLDAIEKTKARVFLLTDAIKAVNVNENDGIEALKEMEEAGAILVTLKDVED
jgi:nicotinamidase/pyrazinamidase